jgi:hypothetical protein
MTPTRRHRTRIALVATVTALTVVAAACSPSPPPPPAPAPATWAASSRPFAASPPDSDAPLTATSTRWWAVVEQRPGAFSAATSSDLLLYRRLGSDGIPSPSPTQTVPLAAATADLVMDEGVLATRSVIPLAGLEVVSLYRLDGPSDSWVAAGSFLRGYDPTRTIRLSVSDTELAVGDSTTDPAGADGRVSVIPLALTPTSLTIDLAGAQLLQPDPAWSDLDRRGFGRAVDVEAGLVAVSGGADHVRLHRRTGTAYPVDLTLTNPAAPASGGSFGASVAVDRSTGADRLLVGTNGRFAGFFGPVVPGSAELFERGPAGWFLRDVIAPASGDPADGLMWGALVALDGDRAVVGVRNVSVPDWPAPGSPPGWINDQRLRIYTLSPAAALEAEISTTESTGIRIGQVAAVPGSPQLAGTHLAFVSSTVFAGGISRWSAVTVDRRPST